MASLILTHEWSGEVKGIDAFPDAHPPVAPVFYAFRLMVGIGFLMLLVSWLGTWRTRQGQEPPRWLARILYVMTFSGWIAVLAGWYVTEIGRQPFLVSGVLRTSEAVTSTPASVVGLSLSLYLALYVLLMLAYCSVVFYLARKAQAAELSESDGRMRPPAAAGPGVIPFVGPATPRGGDHA